MHSVHVKVGILAVAPNQLVKCAKKDNCYLSQKQKRCKRSSFKCLLITMYLLFHPVGINAPYPFDLSMADCLLNLSFVISVIT